MRFLVLSEFSARNPHIVESNCTELCAWISITSPGNNGIDVAHSGQMVEQLKVWFDDARPGIIFTHKPNPIYCSETHANTIVDFAAKWRSKVGLICVNCEAGLCRSPAVAMALSEWVNGHDSGIRDSDAYCPNMFVYGMVKASTNRSII